MGSYYDYSTTWEFYLGLSLALSSNLFIGTSFIIKKKALIYLQKYGVRAGAGGHGYLRQWTWWAGLLTMGIGEAANFVAYAFASASVITPLGALSIVVTAIMSSKFLHERMNILGKIGCFLCMLGTTVIVLNAPKEEQVENFPELIQMMKNPIFIAYVFIILIVNLYVMFYCGPLYGQDNIIIYIFICSSFGSLTVMSCKCLGRAIRDSLYGEINEMENWRTWLLLFSIILCIMIQMNYLNKALDLFNTAVVTPIYYVFFTTFVMTASSILFEDWKHMSSENIIGGLCGFFIVITAIFLLNAFKDLNISYSDIRYLSVAKNSGQRNQNQENNSDGNVLELLLHSCNYNECTRACCKKYNSRKESVT
ncbi:magnesium transporter NIPA2 [Chelonus insularis]|uniref:magnesium transporter NIPA2 n=1 Tax=Chelonus insularis TaxID=460826 RepID=UPI00158C8C77|nr:magnesium transporter NIPA2 [Chelonus insularis]